MNIGYNEIGSDGVLCISSMQGLATLILSCPLKYFEYIKLDCIYGINNLTILDVSGAFIEDSGAQHISRMGRLTVINISDNMIRDEGARHISCMKGITALVLSNNKIGDTGAQHISCMRILEAIL